MIKKLLPYILIHLFLFVSYLSHAQSNNFQCTPQVLGLLPGVPACSTGSGTTTGTPVTASGTTTNATNDSLSGAITSCYSTLSTPLKDVWYQFTASETYVGVAISGSLANPYIAIYESVNGECVGLIPRDCFTSTISTATMEFGPLTYGVKYYLQVASTTNSGGTFTLALESRNKCSDCLKNSILQTYPLPVRAEYHPDTTVGFCYSVLGYKELFGNRLHGVVPVFGSGWDVSSLKIISTADSADFQGVWKWFNNINVKGNTVSGFFYDVGNDNNPVNNLGDKGGLTTIWTFCFSIKTKKACTGTADDLGIKFNCYSDSESGSLISTSNCSGDEDYEFKAHMNCCPKIALAGATKASCNDLPNGKIEAYGGLSLFLWTYELFDSKGKKIDKKTIPVTPVQAYKDSLLTEGNYYLYVTNGQTGACTSTLNIYVPGPASYYFQQTSFSCGSVCTNAVKLVDNVGNIIGHKWNNGSTAATATGLCSGQWHYDTMSVSGSSCRVVDSIFVLGLGTANSQFKYARKNYCTSDTFAVVANFPSPGGTFSIVPPSTSGAILDASTGSINLTNITTAGQIIVKYNTGPPCNASAFDTINVSISPPPVTYTSQSFCTGSPMPVFTNTSSNFTIKWYTDSLLTATSLIQTQSPGGSTYTPSAGIYYVTQTSPTASLCQSVPVTIRITMNPIPIVDAGTSKTICPGFSADLLATGASTYSWQPPGLLNNPLVANPLASPAATTTFTVTGTTSGCSATDTVTIFVSANGKCDIRAYNGFTPNGDNHNDFWHIDGISADDKNQVSIFNRWGEKVWETKNYDNAQNKWDGRGPHGPLPDGTYFYLIQFKGETLKGWVELTR